MFSAEGIGKTIEKAIENALLELKATREDVDIKILNEGGLFKKAKVLVTISEDARDKYEKRKKFVEDEKQVEEKKPQEQKAIEKKTEKPAKTKEAEKQTTKAEKPEHKEIASVAITELQDKKPEKVVDPYQFLKGLFEVAGKTVEIESLEDEKYIHLTVTGDDLGDMIGHRGDCFYAISRLLSAVSGKQDKKILLDIGGFKERRAESLTELAKRTANKVAKSGRYIKLSPMNAGDRRITHTALQDDQRVTTLSKGTEPHRYVIVFPKDDE